MTAPIDAVSGLVEELRAKLADVPNEEWSASHQEGEPGTCLLAQVWGDEGGSLAYFEPTPDANRATAIADYVALCSPANITKLLDALEAQARELSEAREEIERLRGALQPFVDACPDSIIPDLHPMSGTGLGDEWRPNLFVRDFRRARSVLENSPADLRSSDPDRFHSAPVTSGVEVKALEYVKPHGSETLTKAETILGGAVVWTHHEANGRWFWKLGNIASGTEANEADAKKMLWATYERRFRSALAGSREDGA